MNAPAATTLADRLGCFAVEVAAADDETWCLSQRPLARGTTAFVSGTLRDAGTVIEAARRMAHAYDVIHGGSYNHVEVRPARLSYRIDDTRFPYSGRVSATTAQNTMELVLVFVHTMLSLTAGRDLRPFVRAVHVRRSPDAAANTSTGSTLDFWSAPVRLAAPCYRLDYDVHVAALPVAANFGGFDQAAVFAEAVRMANGAGDGPDVPARVRAALFKGVEHQSPIARELGMSVATMRRRLLEAGTGFRTLRAEVLNEKARALLAAHRASVDVAEALGFADARSFARAFRAWNGISPAGYCAGQMPTLSENVPLT